MSVIRSRRDLPLTEAAGWTAVALGASHLVITAVTTRRTWSHIRAQGWWNTVSLARDETLRDSRRSTVFWQTVGSFGVPMAGLGVHMVWSARHGVRVPGWLGGVLLAWGVPFVTVLPASPSWVIPLIGGLVIAGDHDAAPGPGADPEPDPA